MSNILQDNIVAQIAANDHGIKWADRYLKGSTLRTIRQNLLENHITLSYIKNASSVNPGVALFGASQVGKSYLSNYLLTTKSHPLHVYDNRGNAIGFLSTIDPAGNGKEATALVTRFSLSPTYGANPSFPYRVKLLRPIEIVMTIVDGYFNDIKGQVVPSYEEIQEECKRLLCKYSVSNSSYDIISSEEIYELRNYFSTRYLSQRPDFYENLERSGYFATLDSIVGKLSSNDVIEVFSFLWQNNPIIVEAFSNLIKLYEDIKFYDEVYVSIEALNRHTGTILHVDRIYEFIGLERLSVEMQGVVQPAKVKEMSVLLPDGTISFNIPKSQFCMIASEVSFTVVDVNDKELVSEMEREKPFLKKMDILDFPGARSRKEILASGFNYDGLVTMLVRGKVAFLFNKYSHQYLVSSLIFCQDNSQANVTSLPRLIDGWVRDNVGNDISERTKLMSATNGISPLLMVATKFNEYLKQANKLTISDSQLRREEMMNIWVRLASALSSAAVITGASDSWFDKWVNNFPFKVIFPLRGFKYSDGLYEGYEEVDDRITGYENTPSSHFKSILPDLTSTFLDTRSEFVQLHINDAKSLWEEITTENRDGSQPILEYLECVAREMEQIRQDTFTRILTKTFNTLTQSLLKLYHDDNAAAELEKQRKNASRIRLSMNILFGKDKDFFSDFINQLVIDEANLHDVVLDTINAVEVVEETDNDALFAIRESAGIDFEDSYDINLQRLMEDIDCDSVESLEAELGEYGLTVEQVISPYKAKNLSIMIADAIESKWKESNLDPETFASFSARGLKDAQLMILLDNLGALFSKKINVAEKMAERIHPYVSGASSMDDLADMIADICAHMINKFVTSMGAAYYSNEDWTAIANTKEQMKLTVSLHRDAFEKSTFDNKAIKASLAELFNAFDVADVKSTAKRSGQTSHMSNWVEFQQWMDLMEISFIATIGIPTYDVEMNDALRNVMQKYILDVPALHKSVESDKNLTSMVTLNIAAS